MLNPKSLRVGSVVRLEGTVTKREEEREITVVDFQCGALINSMTFDDEILSDAELVPTPVTFDKEQIGQFNHFLTTLLGVKEEDKRSIVHWLREHEDNSRLE